MSQDTVGIPEQGWIGMVMAVQANYYRVRLESAQAPLPHLLCLRRARLKKMGQQVMVGDRVQVAEPDWVGGRGAIESIFPRAKFLQRPAVANVEQILLIFALQDPEPDPWQISRFLVTAAARNVAIQVVLSKADLVSEAITQAWQSRLQTWGYQASPLSLLQDTGLEEIHTQLTGRLSVICGPSGVGKSSLINRLIPAGNLRTGAVSQRWGRGKHTTRHVELFELPQGGLLADSPGFSQPDLTLSSGNLADCFPEIHQCLAVDSCQFYNCRHLDEPGCVVRGDWERYNHYQLFMNELNEQPDGELGAVAATVKFKSGLGGKSRAEPLLVTKTHRRLSRRQQHQNTRQAWERHTEPFGSETADLRLDEDLFY